MSCPNAVPTNSAEAECHAPDALIGTVCQGYVCSQNVPTLQEVTDAVRSVRGLVMLFRSRNKDLNEWTARTARDVDLALSDALDLLDEASP